MDTKILRSEANIHFKFPDTTEVELTRGFYIDNELVHVELNEVFPRMQKLIADYSANLQFDRHFPHLMHLKTYRQFPRDYAGLITFMQLNRQLRSFESPQMCNFTFLQEVNQLLPNMDTLAMTFALNDINFVPPSDSIHFRNVRVAKMNFIQFTSQIRQSLPFIAIDRLESLEVSLFEDQNSAHDFIVDWILEYKTLTSVELRGFDMGSIQLIRLARGLEYLHTMKLNCSSSEAATDMLKLMMDENNLEKIVVFKDKVAHETCFDFLINFLANWKVIKNEKSQLTLGKRISSDK